jgi:dienelactone hydrolase
VRLIGAAVAMLSLFVACSACAVEPTPLGGTEPLTLQGDIPAQLRAGIGRFLARETERSIAERAKLWKRDVSSREAYEKSVAPNRERLRKMIGAVDPRVPVTQLEFVSGTSTAAKLGEADAYAVFAVRWPVLEGVYGEGLLLEPKGNVKANVVALPDAEQTPEMIAGLVEGVKPESQFARRLAESGCRVVVPVLVDRTDEWSGTPDIWMTNKPHREWVYCAAFDLGRHPIGYEVQKILALVDWFSADAKMKSTPIGVAGYGEGGLLALYAAAVDTRIDSTLVSGYFGPRQKLDDEPLYRNLFGLLAEFGDAEIASLIAPRGLVIEHSTAPKVDGPPAAREGRRAWAAPGAIRTPDIAAVRGEVERLKAFFPADATVGAAVELVVGPNDAPIGPASDTALNAFAKPLEFELAKPVSPAAVAKSALTDARQRQHRAVTQLIDHTQMLLARSEKARTAYWKDADATSLETWKASTKKYRDAFWDEVIGRFPEASEPMRPRTRKVIDDPTFTAYEVTLDVWPDVFCFGMLLVPKDIKPGERRPVVVCQHGLEGEPMDTVTRDKNSQGWKYYHAFATRLAEQGFVTYAPHNFYRGGNEFRQLQRRLYPLKKTMYSVILAQHERHLEWLGGLPFVDAKRIGFYGLSYGGFTAIRVPPLLDGYALSISSGEFNDMARKKASTRDVYSYPFYPGYEIFEWNLANTFNYGDLAGFMVPRPFMVERGHDDGVGTDEWVASEYAKVRRRYNKLGIADKTEIEFFNGVHEIHAVGAFEFLHKHLNWPEPN